MGEAYQNFLPPYPRVHLATLPSPLERALRLEGALREESAVVPHIYLKRDDVLSIGLGGNKIRNLEFNIACALSEGASDIVTSGRPQSNHCRLTAAACARTGLTPHLVLSGERPPALTGNLLLNDLLGARMYFCGSDDRAVREKWSCLITSALESLGKRPYVIPVGGSDARGALGHALAAAELLQQMQALGEPLSAIVLATATGGTQAGMLAGLAKLGCNAQIHAFAVAKSASELRSVVHRIACEAAAELDGEPIDPASILIDDSMLGGGYGVPSGEAQAAITMLARTEGVFADPVYTGKALAGLLVLIREGRFRPDDSVVFIHTGGAPALFAS